MRKLPVMRKPREGGMGMGRPWGGGQGRLGLDHPLPAVHVPCVEHRLAAGDMKETNRQVVV